MGKKYVYHYFNIRGRGETPRLIFAAAGVEYTDNRIEFSEWPKLKGSYPLGALPVFEEDGQQFPESIAISRYLANEFGLAGNSNLEKLKIDVIVDLLVAIRESVVARYFEKDEAKKADILRKCVEEQIPKSFAYIKQCLVENSDGRGFLVGERLSWADLALLDLGDMLHGFEVLKDLCNYPEIKALKERVEAVPNIAAYLNTRHVTPR
ncbi:S-crystallin SL11 [Patella vulgata]|uniref:S-crystallin SL11 n=1 Tax=Patella vulgata TaxID=6465 RepID=UPI00217F2774|nr:S-crystallin SL11 [Patella vulgata]